MKNAWKGLVIGALTGMVGGWAMDAATGIRRKVAAGAHQVLDKERHVAKPTAP